MRDAAVLVFVATTLSNILSEVSVSVCFSKSTTLFKLTDLTTGLFAITLVLKLNGPAVGASPEPFSVGVTSSAGPVPKLNEAFVGLRRSEFTGSKMALLGNVSLRGDKASRSIDSPALACGAWTVPSSDGGVGVRGGIGKGRFDAIANACRTRLRRKNRAWKCLVNESGGKGDNGPRYD